MPGIERTFDAGLRCGARAGQLLRRSAAQPVLSRRWAAPAGLTLVFLVLASSSPASAATRMPVGFHDDATFRWGPGAAADLDRASMAQASMIRTIADWRQIAPARPRKATDSFDPAYAFGNLDDLVRNAQRRGLQVMITIWGTPQWANGGDGPNVAPTRASDMADFGRAIADRYSGRHAGFPHVGRYSIWNEPNLEIFLAPQFDRNGTIVSPRTYATLYRAGYAGIKAGNPTALVAIGETSNQGRDRPARGAAADSVAPGTFARLLARERNLSFDAYATHPYPDPPGRSADGEGSLAERHPVAVAAVRGVARPVVQAPEHPCLDHRVRLPDEAR